jgi:hypothetical protein
LFPWNVIFLWSFATSIVWLKPCFISTIVCSSLLPPHQQGAFFFHLERSKRLWHDYSTSSSLGNRTWTKCKSIRLNYMPSDRNSQCHTSFLCCEVGRAKKVANSGVRLELCALERTYSLTMASCEAIVT